MASRGLYAWLAFGLITGFGFEYFVLSISDFGFFSVRDFSFVRAIIVSLIFAAAFGIPMEFFIRKMSDKMRVKEDNIDGENLLFQGGASHLQSGKSIGGWLILTKGHLIFRPHGVNIGGEVLKIPTNEIFGVQPFGIAGVIPLGLKVFRKGQDSTRFSVFDRDMWVELLKKETARSDGSQ